jgi:hypothetical protein
MIHVGASHVSHVKKNIATKTDVESFKYIYHFIKETLRLRQRARIIHQTITHVRSNGR